MLPFRPLAATATLLLALPALALADGGGGADRAAGAQPGATAAATRTVRVADDFFSPSRLTVRRGTTIRWAWSRRNSNRHDVALRARPRGVRRFRSPSARRSFVFRRKLRRPGAYRFVCTFHDGMAMRISVRR
jgi:plastocyanin